MEVVIQGDLALIVKSTGFLEIVFRYTNPQGRHHFQLTPNYRVDVVLQKIRDTIGKELAIKEALDELLTLDGLSPAILCDGT